MVNSSFESYFCGEALEDALQFGKPEIFNTDKGSQFTLRRSSGRLERAGVAISMDGRGRALDNVFIERLWRTVKYECLYLHGYRRVQEGWLRTSASTTAAVRISPWNVVRQRKCTSRPAAANDKNIGARRFWPRPE